MSKPYLKEYNTTIVVEGKLKTIRAFVVLGEDGKVLSGPHEEQEVAERELVALKSSADIEAYLVSTGVDPEGRGFKAKRNLLLGFQAYLATPRKEEPVAEAPESDSGVGAPAAGEASLDDKDEF